jgi:hypothetical protein
MIGPFRPSILPCLVATAMVVTLTGCSGIRESRDRAEREQHINVYPDNFKSDLLAFLRTYLNDPTGIRDAYVADPVLKTSGAQTRYVACVRFNAKNSDGRYVGSKEGIAVYSRGRFEQFVEQPRDQSRDPVREQCNDANYQRFPELEALRR